jgi:signal transduction histidine kinase
VTGAGTALLALGALVLTTTRVAVLARRLRRIEWAEHELRAPVTALALACERWGRGPGRDERVEVVEAQLERLRAGLFDLGRARGAEPRAEPGSPVDLSRFTWAAAGAWREPAPPRAGGPVVRADRGRLAQVVGNLVDNAAEHGGGELEVTARRTPTGTRLELRNPPGSPSPRRAGYGRGRGLAIAKRAARDLGGGLDVRSEDDAVVASLDLPDQPDAA